MRKLLVVVALVLALLSAIGMGAGRSVAAAYSSAVQSHQLASHVTPLDPICPGGSSTSCG